MKLNSRKKNKVSKIKISILFILMFYLFFNFYGDKIINNIVYLKEEMKILSSSKEELIEENNFLKQENELLKVKNIFANYYYNRVKELEGKLNYQNKKGLSRISLKVFYNNSFLIAHGNKNISSKINENDIVYLKENFALGKVFDSKNNIIKIKKFSDYGVENNYLIIQNGEVLAKVLGVGDSNGLIKLELPRDLTPDKNSILVLDNEEKSLVAIFLKDEFKLQETHRNIYYKVFFNPYILEEVEI